MYLLFVEPPPPPPLNPTLRKTYNPEPLNP